MNVQDFYPLFLRSSRVVIDSRTVEENDIFFAFSGTNFDGATQAKTAVLKGAAAAVVENPEYADPVDNIYCVESTLGFLQDLARFHRSQLNIPVIALTGSNGKTTTKELMHAVLSQGFEVQYTRGNLNNHIGVPLTVLSIRAEHQMAVVEMGANHQKEIELLCDIARPDYGYITNFGKAHLEGFGGVEGVIKGKSELYDHLIHHQGTILVNDEDAVQVEKTKDYTQVISFGSAKADYRFDGFEQNNRVGLRFSGYEALSKLTGSYNLANLCAAAALGEHFGIRPDLIKTAIESYTPSNMRSQIVEKDGKVVVLDTYNANPSSMELSLKNFAQYQGSKTVILGDMLELGSDSEQEHIKILQLTADLGFDRVITVGPLFAAVNEEGTSLQNTADAAMELKENPVSTENILLKGSRGIALEKLFDIL